MRILFVAWNDSLYENRGLIIYLKDLAKNLVEYGNEIQFFYSGGYDIRLKPYLRKKISGKISEYEFVNSPNFPPKQKGRPKQDISHPKIESIFEDLLKEINPDIIFFREIEGLCANLIEIAAGFKNAKTICMFGNYAPLCPEIDLFNYNKNQICYDFENGRACIPCNSWGNQKIYSDFYNLFLNNQIKMSKKVKIIYRTVLKRLIRTLIRDINSNPKRVNPQQYYSRRKKFVEIVNKCDLLITISKKQKEIFDRYGVKAKKMITVSMLVSHQDRIGFSSFDGTLPIKFGYIGRINELKGCGVLIKAFFELKNVADAKLYLHGPIEGAFFRQYSDVLNGKMNNIIYGGKYSKNNLAEILNNIDVGIIPSIWEECYGHVGPEFLSASIPIIGSNIGGIPDYLIEGKNGYLFQPGDVSGLISTIKTITENPGIIKTLKRNIKKNTNYDAHIKLMNNIFRATKNDRLNELDSINLISWVEKNDF